MSRPWPFSYAEIGGNQEDDINPHAERGEAILSLISSFEDLTKNSKSSKPHLEQYRDLAVTACKSLRENVGDYARNVHSQHDQHPKHLQAMTNGLKSILPSLQNRVTALSLSLDPSETLQDPVAKLGTALKHLFELNKNLDSIQLLYNSDRTERVGGRRRHLGKLEKFKIHTLTQMLISVCEQIHRLILLASNFIISCLGSPKNSIHQENLSSYNHFREVIQQTFWQSINKLNEWLAKSDISLVLEHLKGDVKNKLEDSLKYVLSPKDPEENWDLEDGFGWKNRDTHKYHLPTDQMTELRRVTLPIIKLTRLFFNKLSKTKANKIMFSNLSSEKLSSLFVLVKSIPYDIDKMLAILDFYEDINREERFFREADRPTNKLRDHFENILSSILFPYFESLPSTQFDDHEIHPKTWLLTWQLHFLAATSKFDSATCWVFKNAWTNCFQTVQIQPQASCNPLGQCQIKRVCTDNDAKAEEWITHTLTNPSQRGTGLGRN